ncbi:MAG: DUF2961 domain-containing protein, partial [Planctomycetes bacterium]|nr:DUF2961 domain-containing protein [Planctomycetota bacterium]
MTDTFSSLFNPRFKTFARSSSDPNDTATLPSYGNDDGFSGQNDVEAYRETDAFGEYAVLTHQSGRPGYLSSFFRNFWGGLGGLVQLPWENTRAQWFFEDQLWFDMPLMDYFRSPGMGQIPPFDGPFTESRAGGHITYAPMMWENDFKLRVMDNWFFNAARFHRVTGVLGTWDDLLELPDRDAWEVVANNAGSWPHQTTRVPHQVVLNVPGNGGALNIPLSGPATILEFTATVTDPAHWDGLVARFTFDGALFPQVDIPLRMLGGMVRQPFSAPVTTLLMNNNGNDRITCYFPMHFASTAVLEIVNDNPGKGAQVTIDYCLGTGTHPGDWGYFTTSYNEGITQTGVPFPGPSISDAQGMVRFMCLESSINNFGTIPGSVSLMHIEGDLC